MTKELPGKRGRKTKYYTHVEPRLEEIGHWCRDGLTEEEICRRLGVSLTSFAEYKKQFPELTDTLKVNREIADYRVENATYIVKDGQITQVAAPKSGYGEQRIIYKDGKPFDIIKVERTRITGHDVI